MLEIPAVPLHWTFPAAPASAGRARRSVAEALPRGLAPHIGADLALLTSELVTNAVRYGARPEDAEVIELVLWAADGHYWVAVSDPGVGEPRVGSPRPEGCGGRGLVLVDSLAAVWGVAPRRYRGKSVVAGLRLPDR